MLFMAQVIDNSEFFKTGKIKVRVVKDFNSNMVWDISSKSIGKGGEQEKYLNKGNISRVNENGKSTIKYGTTDGTIIGTRDEMASVFTSLGGGKNYGVFYLPHINTKGVVSYIDGTELVWMGSIFDGFSKSGTDEMLNIPSDKLEAEGTGIAVTADSNGRPINFDGDENTIVVRLKSTSKDEIDWDRNGTENLIVIDKNRVQIRHIENWDTETTPESKSFTLAKYEEFSIESGEINVKSVNNTDGVINSISIVNDEIKISSKKNKDNVERFSRIRMSSKDNASFVAETQPSKDVFCSLNIGDGVITISAEKKTDKMDEVTPVSFSLDLAAGKASINASNVTISAEKELTLGTGMYYLLASSDTTPIKVQTTTLTPITKIRVG